MKVVFVGGGNMASALIGGLIAKGTQAANILVIDPDADARLRIAKNYPDILTLEKADASLAGFNAVVLAVKPQAASEVGAALAPFLSEEQLVVSIIAGIRSDDLSRWLAGHTCIVRCMPNTPALIGKGISGLAATPQVSDASRDLADRLLSAVGATVWVDDEASIDTVTAVSGSGPAYVFYFIEALQEAARRLGLSEDQGRALAIATFEGASQLASQSPDSPSVLREKVTSKGGTTAAALAAFDQANVKESIIAGVLAARQRAADMADELASAG